MLRVSAFVLISACLCNAAKLPDYIHPCRVNDPKLDECIDARANEVIPILVKGDAALNLPPLSPFPVDLDVPPSNTCKFSLKGGKAEGLEKAQIIEPKFVPKALTASGTIYIPKVVVTGPYEIEGKLYNKAVKCSGVANITFDDLSVTFVWPFELYKKGDLDHLKLKIHTHTNKVKFARYSFESEDKAQALELNKFVNENWKDFTEKVLPSLSKSVADVTNKAIDAVITYSSLNEIFLP